MATLDSASLHWPVRASEKLLDEAIEGQDADQAVPWDSRGACYTCCHSLVQTIAMWAAQTY
ncbi:unnamed protein product [marine sediment metagenome]|uniref:Uncharacterized protein n=1 Tax=marine sediment metagenome TaxID=412755 RepID=X0VZH1_9ZZZZ